MDRRIMLLLIALAAAACATTLPPGTTGRGPDPASETTPSKGSDQSGQAPPVLAPEPPLPPPRPSRAPEVARALPPRPDEPVRLGRPDAGTPTTGSISLDVYLRQIQAKIGDRWSPPRAAAAGGERAVVMFEIGRDGQIKEPKLERESGNPLYDQSALRAVVDASPSPPLPAEFKASSLLVHFGFDFRP